ncbi:MAG: hypothetical protein BM564_13035 [Bacteroidetes bacterium MedPE-SWsnd-G2]|nr:MAG: hypothetical protein BM564_13035 [Bacteroidetes bacterium MedPE-SWsnd-G2]
MNPTQFDLIKFKSDLSKLRVLLILITAINLAYMIVVFGNAKLWLELYIKYNALWILIALQIMVAAIFIWFNWVRMPLKKEAKISNTFMLLFLGIFGMWLWFPNKADLKTLSKKINH